MENVYTWSSKFVDALKISKTPFDMRILVQVGYSNSETQSLSTMGIQSFTYTVQRGHCVQTVNSNSPSAKEINKKETILELCKAQLILAPFLLIDL